MSREDKVGVDLSEIRVGWGVASIPSGMLLEYRIERPRPVLTKRDFVDRYRKSEFGNASPTWNTLEDFLKELESAGTTQIRREWRPNERFHLRSRIAGGPTYYNLFWHECVNRWSLEKEPKDWYVSEMAPNCYLLNAEVMQSERGLDLFYSTVNKPMREALREKSERVSGITSVLTLRRYLDPNSLDWLYVLLERYRGHVVEFSTFARKWGTIPGYNTCFWEIRNY